MKNRFYLAHLGFCTQQKNNLHKAYYELCKAEDRKLIAEDDLLAYKLKFVASVDKLNATFPRSKPINISFFDHLREPADTSVHSHTGVEFKLLVGEM